MTIRSHKIISVHVVSEWRERTKSIWLLAVGILSLLFVTGCDNLPESPSRSTSQPPMGSGRSPVLAPIAIPKPDLPPQNPVRIPYIIKVLEKRGGQLNAKSQGVETYEMRLQYPTFGDENYDVLNQAITEYMNGRKSDFLGAVANMDEPVMRLVKLPYQLILRCEVFLATPKFASVAFELSAKMGETNTVNDFCAFNYDPAKRQMLSIMDCLMSAEQLDPLSAIVQANLKRDLGTQADETWIKRGCEPKPDSFTHFTFKKDQVTFYFLPDAVANRSLGYRRTTLPFNQIRPLLNPEILVLLEIQPPQSLKPKAPAPKPAPAPVRPASKK